MLSCDTVNAVDKADCSNDKVVNKIQEKVMALSGRGTDYQVPLWDLTRAHNTKEALVQQRDVRISVTRSAVTA